MLFALLSQFHKVVSLSDSLLNELYFGLFLLSVNQFLSDMAFCILQVLDSLSISANRLYVSFEVSVSHRSIRDL